jgi:hypothetical protein
VELLQSREHKPGRVARLLGLPLARVYHLGKRLRQEQLRVLRAHDEEDVFSPPRTRREPLFIIGAEDDREEEKEVPAAREEEEPPRPATALSRKQLTMSHREEIVQCVRAFLMQHGLQGTTLGRLRAHVALTVFGGRHTPGLIFVRDVLRGELNMRWRRFDPKDRSALHPMLGPKRAWVSRLVLRFLLEDALVISLDESSLALDTYSKKQWQPGAAIYLPLRQHQPTLRGSTAKRRQLRVEVPLSDSSYKRQLVPGKVRSLTLISAITSDWGHFSQVLASAADGVLFASFVDGMLDAILGSAKYKAKPRPVVLFMDNASIHRSKVVRNVVSRRGVFALFNAAYSPFLNPVERYFSLIKRRIRKHELTTVSALVRLVVDEFHAMSEADIKYMWRTTAPNWHVELRAQ